MYIEKKKLFLFITTGETGALYTLREQTSGIEVIGYDQRAAQKSYHIKTLSKDYDKALKLAKEYAESSPLNLRFEDEPPAAVRNIVRRSSEEMQSIRDKLSAEQAERKQAKDEQRKQRIEEAMKDFGLESPLSFGKYSGKEDYPLSRIVTRDRDYLEYILKQNQPADGNTLPFPEPNNPYQAQVNWIFTNVKFEEIKESNFVGEVNETITFEGLCEKVTYQSVQVNAYHSVGMLSYRVVNESGDCVEFSYSGDKWEMEEGQTYSFSATVKRHKTYRTKKTTELKKISKVQIV